MVKYMIIRDAIDALITEAAYAATAEIIEKNES